MKMNKILPGLAFMALIHLNADDTAFFKQGAMSQDFISSLDLNKLKKCPQYTSISEHSAIKESDKVVAGSANNLSAAKIETFKNGLTLTIDGCIKHDDTIELRVKNALYWIEKQ